MNLKLVKLYSDVPQLAAQKTLRTEMRNGNARVDLGCLTFVFYLSEKIPTVRICASGPDRNNGFGSFVFRAGDQTQLTAQRITYMKRILSDQWVNHENLISAVLLKYCGIEIGENK